MEYKNLFSFNVKWNYKTISMFLFLLVLPNLLGVINLPTMFGFKIHFFQIAVFIAALLYGPMGGMMSGLIGSFYSALIMSNPYILVGNAILGLFVGLFFRYGLNVVISVLLAYLVQLPWLIVTDYYFVGLSVVFIRGLVIALFVSNMIWAVVAHYSLKPIRKSLE
jgi:uncharacterized membrane protein|tara:strand:- start:437 stop:931 length:495 start_codon:yes stop_codon:yes gene_type:complete